MYMNHWNYKPARVSDTLAPFHACIARHVHENTMHTQFVTGVDFLFVSHAVLGLLPDGAEQ